MENKNESETKLLNINESESDYESEKEQEEPLKSRDPLQSKKIALSYDFYSLTWYSIKKDTFKDKKFRGEEVTLLPQDYVVIYGQFLAFVTILILSIFLVVYQSVLNDIYVKSTIPMIILRILLVAFVQLNIGAEFQSGYAKFVYPLVRREEFFHPNFAIFVGFSHCLVCVFVIIGLIFFLAVADEFADPVCNFAGICVLIELDNWLADAILSYKLKNDEDLENEDKDKAERIRKNYNLRSINDKLHVFNKLAMISEEEMDLIYDERDQNNLPLSIVFFEKLSNLVPWVIVTPLLTIPVNYYLPQLTHYLNHM